MVSSFHKQNRADPKSIESCSVHKYIEELDFANYQ